MNYEVLAVFITPKQGEAMKLVEMVEARVGVGEFPGGLIGDRYYNRDGFWQTHGSPERKKIPREVSIISIDSIDSSSYSACETRRNFVVNIPAEELNNSLKKIIKIGPEVEIEITEECTPCKRPGDLSGKPGFEKQFRNKGGVRGKILTDGSIHPGDSVIIFSRR